MPENFETRPAPPPPPRKSPEIQALEADLVRKKREQIISRREKIVAQIGSYFENKRKDDVNPAAIEVDDGRGLHIEKMYLYHGSATPAIDVLRKADDTTIGNGLYLTDASSAARYADVRATDYKVEPRVVYEVKVTDAKFFDIRKKENMDWLLPKLKGALSVELKETEAFTVIGALREAMITITTGNVDPGSFKMIARQVGHVVKDVLQAEGYDGLIGTEGGESGGSGSAGFNHDSYVYFSPEELTITEEKRAEV
ncbi:MAG: hypothetical protein HYR90_00025 [Candidatus Andersenbacteria bacterium]|nr:hypothetical protein [Candidatus Andersenbacteria bacterium]MBI3250793.1 hypothetical protein [Candidatus Andersenbacteria bacterium]